MSCVGVALPYFTSVLVPELVPAKLAAIAVVNSASVASGSVASCPTAPNPVAFRAAAKSYVIAAVTEAIALSDPLSVSGSDLTAMLAYLNTIL